MYDVAIIGGGVVGSALAFKLSLRKGSFCLLERENDIALAATRANSAILHAGFDPEPGTLMARLNVEGVRQAAKLCRDLSVPYRNNGALVLAVGPEDDATLRELLRRGVANGVPGLKILTREETLAKEPNVNPEVTGALWAPTSSIVNPWEYAIAMAETAARNGVEFKLEHRVVGVNRSAYDTAWHIVCDNGAVIGARAVVNAAGVHSDEIHALVAPPSFTMRPTLGEYYLLDKSEGTRVSATLFQCPSAAGKGVLVSPTVHGNLIVGPDAVPTPDRDSVKTARAGLDFVRAASLRSVPSISWRASIRNFAGMRANTNRSDFIIASPVPGFVDLAGIKSPGLSAAPAIADEAVALLRDKCGLELDPKPAAATTREHIVFRDLSDEAKAKLVWENPLYGRVICRCETITEAEIVAAVHSPIPARTVDGVKRRCNAGMGRCQGGFCGPRVLEILARELGIDPLRVEKDKSGSNILVQATKSPAPGPAPAPKKSGGNRDIFCSLGDISMFPSEPDDPAAGKPFWDSYDVVVVGGGPAGLAAALAAKRNGAESVLIVERDKELGGILNQCVHNGFGLHRFKEELTGPEYARRFIEMLKETDIDVLLDTMVLDISGKIVCCVGEKSGYRCILAKAVVLAMGCRERTRGAISIPGDRPAGVFTAGTAQRYLNIEGYMVGRRVLILGSGDIGLIMARRLTLEGAKVLACVEVMPASSGLQRNIAQCLDDFGIPLLLSHTVVDIQGMPRVRKAVVARVDGQMRPIPGTEREFECDTVLLSVGLIPENELTSKAGIEMDRKTNGPVAGADFQTSLPGVFACGNVLRVYDLVDNVSRDAETAGKFAAEYAKGSAR